MRARLLLRHSGGECLLLRPRTCTDCGLQHGRRHEVPIGGVSLRLHVWCEAEAHSRCMLIFASDTWVESAYRHDHALALIVVCATGAAMKLRQLMKQARGCCTVRGSDKILKVRARLWLGHSCCENLPPRPRTCTGCVLRNGRCHEDPTTDVASLRQLHGARPKRTQGACSSLHREWRVLAATTTHLHYLWSAQRETP